MKDHKLTVGDRVQVQPHGYYTYRNRMTDSRGHQVPGTGGSEYVAPKPWTGTIVAEMEHDWLVAYDDPTFGAPWTEQGYAEHVVEACKAAGLDPSLHIGIANKHGDQVIWLPEGFEPITEIKPLDPRFAAFEHFKFEPGESKRLAFLPEPGESKRLAFLPEPDGETEGGYRKLFEGKPFPDFSKEPKGTIDTDAIQEYLDKHPLKIDIPSKDDDKEPSK